MFVNGRQVMPNTLNHKILHIISQNPCIAAVEHARMGGIRQSNVTNQVSPAGLNGKTASEGKGNPKMNTTNGASALNQNGANDFMRGVAVTTAATNNRVGSKPRALLGPG